MCELSSLLHQGDFPGEAVSNGIEPEQVNPAGQAAGIELHAVGSLLEISGRKAEDFLAFGIVEVQRGGSGTGQAERDGGAGIEGIGIGAQVHGIGAGERILTGDGMELGQELLHQAAHPFGLHEVEGEAKEAEIALMKGEAASLAIGAGEHIGCIEAGEITPESVDHG